MRASQFEILERDLANALSQVKPSELSQCRGYVDMVLEEYDSLDEASKVDLNPVSYLNSQLSEHTYSDLSFFNLVIAEILTRRITLNNEESNLDLVHLAIGAINYWKIYRDKHELAEKQYARGIAVRNRKASDTMIKGRYKSLRKLIKRIFEMYEPAIESLHRDNKDITYRNIARRIEPLVESLNKKPGGGYHLGDSYQNRRVKAIKARLEKAVQADDLKSTRYYKK